MTTTVAPDARPDTASASAPTAPSASEPSTPSAPAPGAPGLGAELRESLLLLGFAVGVTVGLTTAAQAALALLG